MIPAEQIAAARAVPMPALVARDRPLKRSGHLFFALCANHSERTPSMAVYPDHVWCFGCGFHADPIEWVRRVRGLDFAAAVSELASGFLEGERRHPKSAGSMRPEARLPRSIDPPAAISDLWRAATHPSIARVYLRSRGLPCEPLSAALRGHPAVWCSETREERPALLAAVHDSQNRLVALQRIWTRTRYLAGEPDARPLDLQHRKKTIGTLADGAVRLSPAGERLGLAEGVETASAASKLYKLPVWAVLGTSRYGHPAGWRETPSGRPYRVEEKPPSVWIPPTVREIVIFGDRGDAGETAALWAESWSRRQGLVARALFPQEKYGDFAEVLLDE